MAEEVKVPFRYDDVLLESASQEELSLIDFAIEDEENNEHGVDWTSKLGINLRYCVKVRKNPATEKIQHALSVGGLFSDASPMLDMSTIKWLQRKSRSKAKPSSTSSFTPREHLEVTVDGKLGENLDSQSGKKEEKIIQYTRKKKLNPKPAGEQAEKLAKSDDSDKKCNELANRSHLDSAIPSEMNNGIRGSERVIGRSGVSFSINPCYSSLTGAHGQEHPETSNGAVEMSDQELEEPMSMVTSIKEEQKSQMVEGEEANIASENIVVDMIHDDEPLPSRDILSSSNGDEASSNGLQAPDNELSMESQVSSSENTEVIKAPGEAKKKRKIERESETNDKPESSIGFIRSPCEGLRSRGRRKATCEPSSDLIETSDEVKKPAAKRLKKTPKTRTGSHHQEVSTTSHHNRCFVEGCKMTFESKSELQAHKRNRCTHEGCGKKLRAHKYLVLHQRVHNDDRPFGCSWKGCSMTFKWQWARTEHLRLHTGERPYKCKVEGCGLSFRFVSDYSRHRRKTGHYVT